MDRLNLIRNSNGRLILLFFVLTAEILSYFASSSDAMRAVAVSMVFAVVTLMAFLTWCMSPSFNIRQYFGRPLAVVVILGGVGVYSLFIAIHSGNNNYYLAADIYHWFIEFLFMIMFSAWAFEYAGSRQIAMAAGIYGLILGFLGFLVFVFGTAGLITGEMHRGHIIPDLGVWRLTGTKGFPELLLVFVTAVLFSGRSWDKTLRFILWVAFILLLFDTIVTFKRSQWFSYLGVFALIVMSKKRLATCFLTALLAIPTLMTFLLLFPDTVITLLQGAGKSVEYSSRFSTESTLALRILQVTSVFPILAENPFGLGLGAEFYTYITSELIFTKVHYIHNLYIYYLIQFGSVGTFIIATVGGWLAWTFWRHVDMVDEWDWMVRAGLAGLVVIAVNGMVLVSTHTVFAGFFIALGLTAISRISTAHKGR